MNTVRLFRLTRTEYFADFLITPPLTVLAVVVSASYGLAALWPALFIAGLFAWTFYEYAIHRWVLHLALWNVLHRLHHEKQSDYIALHPAMTLALYAAGWAIFGVRSSAFMIGFSVGYILYALLHTAFHYWPQLPRFLLAARKRHVVHHRYDTMNYGVLTSVWDRLFRTEFHPEP